MRRWSGALAGSGKAARGLRVGLGLLVLAAAGAAVAAGVGGHAPEASVLKVRLGGDAGQTRVVVELTAAVAGKLIQGSDPTSRVLLALPHAESPGDMAGPGAGLVKAWAVDDVAGTARLRLDLARNAVVRRRFLLPPGDGLGVYRYIVDLQQQGPQSNPATGAVRTSAATPIELPLEPATPARKVVVIDAGHGGKDPGAQGQTRFEKDVTLAAAKSLRDQLNATGRYHVVLTRDTDVFVPLQERVRIARRANADLFISLHADSLPDPSVQGATVYTLSDKGVDRAARGVFGKPDYFLNVDLPGQDPAVNRILLDLTQRETNNRSSVFASRLLDRIGERTPLLRRSHRDAGFVVLLAPDVPAVLLEMGFITNAADERRLADAKARRTLMGGVAEAIDSYFDEERRYASR